MSINPTLGRLEQEDYHESVLHSQFGASLGYRVRMELDWVVDLSGRALTQRASVPGFDPQHLLPVTESTSPKRRLVMIIIMNILVPLTAKHLSY